MNKNIDPLFSPEEIRGMSASEVDEASELIQRQIAEVTSVDTMVDSIHMLAKANGLTYLKDGTRKYIITPNTYDNIDGEKLGEFVDMVSSYDLRVVEKYYVPALRSAVDTASILSERAKEILHEQLNSVVHAIKVAYK